jgi:hypothetical protein
MSQDEGTAVVAQDVAVDEVELGSAPSKKQLQKKEVRRITHPSRHGGACRAEELFRVRNQAREMSSF